MIDIPFLPLYTGGGENIGFSRFFFKGKLRYRNPTG
jgi:hypothetical protein